MMTLYRLLITIAFPERFRRSFGPDMVRLFEHPLAEARAAGAGVTVPRGEITRST